MTIVTLRKILVFAMTVVGFLTLHLSGALHPVVVGLFYVAVFGAWFWEEPRVDLGRWERPWTVLTLSMFAFTMVDIFFIGEFFLTSAMNFLVFLAGAKLFQLAENKDFTQMMALALVLLASGSVVNAELSFGVLFGLFVIVSTLGLTVQHLNVEVFEQEGRQATRTRMDSAVFWATFSLAVAVFCGAIAFFFVFPRVGVGLFMQQSRDGVTTSGFGDSVELGGHGTIRSDNSVVLRVIFPDGPPIDPRTIYWRGKSLDHYSGRRWSDDDERGRDSGLVRREVDGRGYIIDQPPDVSWREAIADTIVAEINLEPIGSDVLFTIGEFRALSLPDNVTEFPDSIFSRALRADVTGEVTLSERSSLGVTYLSYSVLDQPDPDRLRAATWPEGAESLPDLLRRYYRGVLERREEPAPAVFDPLAPQVLQTLESAGEPSIDEHAELAGYYLQLPEQQVTERIRGLNLDLRSRSATDYDFAAALEAYLRTLEYTTDRPEPSGPEANLVDEFLFDWRRGHCEYFATAMVVLLRAEGIPARIVNGFLGADYNSVGEFYTVRQANAHSWVEVYFPGEDVWVTFDPTPAVAPVIGGDGLWWKLQMGIDNLRLKWFRWVVEYDLEKQYTLVRNAVEAIQADGADDPAAVSNQLGGIIRGILIWLWQHGRALSMLLLLWVVSAGLFRRRARNRTPWGAVDVGASAGWLLGATVVIAWLWPEGWTVVSALVALLPPALGITVAYLVRRDLFDLGDGRKARSRGTDIVSSMYARVLQVAERETGELSLSTTSGELTERLDLEDPTLVAELRAFAEFYEQVRFAGLSPPEAELEAWRARHRRLVRGIARDLRAQIRREGGSALARGQ